LSEDLAGGGSAVLGGPRALLHDAVGEHVHGDGLDVVGGDVVAALDHRMGAGGPGQVDGAAGAHAGDQGAVAAGAVGDLDDVLRDRVVEADLVDLVGQPPHVLGGED